MMSDHPLEQAPSAPAAELAELPPENSDGSATPSGAGPTREQPLETEPAPVAPGAAGAASEETVQEFLDRLTDRLAVLEGGMERVQSETALVAERTRELLGRTAQIAEAQRLAAEQLRRFGAKVEQVASGAAQSQFRQLVESVLLVFDLVDSMAQTRSPQALDPPDQLCRMLSRQMLQALQANGVEEISASGAPDYQVHRAVEMTAVDDPAQVGQILAVSRRGFRLGDRVLRPAEVVVGVDNSPPAGSAGG